MAKFEFMALDTTKGLKARQTLTIPTEYGLLTILVKAVYSKKRQGITFVKPDPNIPWEEAKKTLGGG